MLPNAFIGKPDTPTDHEIAYALGTTSKTLWDTLLAELSDEHKLTRDWNSYSKKAGWALRLQREKRNIVYLSPGEGGFTASFALGEKALQAARASKLPTRALKIIDEAKRYAEGTAVRIDVNNAQDIAIVKKLAKAKLDN